MTGTMTVATVRERLDGYLTALTEAGIAPDSSLVVPAASLRKVPTLPR